LQTLSGVLSTKLIPVHLPSNTFLMKRAKGALGFAASLAKNPFVYFFAKIIAIIFGNLDYFL